VQQLDGDCGGELFIALAFAISNLLLSPYVFNIDTANKIIYHAAAITGS